MVQVGLHAFLFGHLHTIHQHAQPLRAEAGEQQRPGALDQHFMAGDVAQPRLYQRERKWVPGCSGCCTQTVSVALCNCIAPVNQWRLRVTGVVPAMKRISMRGPFALGSGAVDQGWAVCRL